MASTGAALLAALALTGCGSPSAAIKHASVKPIVFKSAAVSTGRIGSTYTCDGRNISPSFEWGEVPPETKELALIVIGLVPSGPKNNYAVSVEWAVAGLNPALRRIAAGHLPTGAYLGTTTKGKTKYSICPAAGGKEFYQFTLYAVPPTVTIPRSFSGEAIFRTFSSSNTSTPPGGIGVVQAFYTRKR